ncbi:MAG: hypothetical protein ABSD96_08505 [Candidatus Korobacteraceae bacterium]
MANRTNQAKGSRFSYEQIGHYIDQHGYDEAADYVCGLIESGCSHDERSFTAAP